MDSNYIIQKVLSDEEVLYLKSLIFSSNVRWLDGVKTIVNHSKNNNKKNLEIDCNSDIRYQISNFVLDKFYQNKNFSRYCIPYKSYPAIISKTLSGGYYRLHEDSGFMGDYSTTLFISSPSEYEGGELSLYIDGQEKSFKLECGMAITYKTGIPHQVKTVISGQRVVSVFWTHSRFRDPIIRRMYSDTLELGDILLEQGDELESNINFEIATKDPRYILHNIQNNLIRQFSIIEQ